MGLSWRPGPIGDLDKLQDWYESWIIAKASMSSRSIPGMVKLLYKLQDQYGPIPIVRPVVVQI